MCLLVKAFTWNILSSSLSILTGQYSFFFFEPWRPIEPGLMSGFCSTKRTSGTHPQDRMLVYRWILPFGILSTLLTCGWGWGKGQDDQLDRASNHGPFDPKSDALTTRPSRSPNNAGIICLPRDFSFSLFKANAHAAVKCCIQCL